MINFVKTKTIWFVLSGFFVVASIGTLFAWGLKFGIDFTGGTLLEVTLQEASIASQGEGAEQIKATIENITQGETKIFTGVVIQPTGEKDVIIKMRHVSNEERQQVLDALGEAYGAVTEKRFETIGPSIGKELQRKSLQAIVLVLAAIILYISWAFRKVSSGPVPSWAYGVSAIIALIHDVLIVIGMMSVLGYFFSVEVDSLFITAILTVLGFSVHDTIVVYDRIREQLKKNAGRAFDTVINASINSTLLRSINTSLTTVIVLVALLLFGGDSLKYFVLALIVGIVSGTYSSICIASPLLLYWQKLLRRKFY